MKEIPDLRPSPIAGTWYSADPVSLRQTIDRLLDDAPTPDLTGKVIMMMVPHAGHRYSGGVAARAFKAVQGQKFDLVVVAAPMHQYHFGQVLTSAHTAYETPLGVIPIDQQALQELDESLTREAGFSLTPVAFDPEHAVEIELPFIQRSLAEGFMLLPLMLRDQSARTAHALGKALAELLAKRNALMIASTDLSHFYSQEEAAGLDHAILQQVEAFSPEGIHQVEASGKGYACGLGAVTSMLWAARALGADRVKLVGYATSGDVTGDQSSVVGYGAAVVYKAVN